MGIKATTNIYGIFGHPVSQSLSPVMHNSAFSELGLDCVYVAFDIDPKEIAQATESLRTMGIKGINITIPHKQSIMPHLDEISPDAKLTGAVNTVKNTDGTLLGFNTDVGGVLRAIKEELGFSPDNSRVLLIGAGGAGRAVLSGFCMNNASSICIADRAAQKAQKLALEFRTHFPDVEISTLSLQDDQVISREMNNSDILINASSAGMNGENNLELPIAELREGAVVYDLVYKPLETELVTTAKELGYKASGGLSMLLYQGAESFEIWTGEPAPVETMRKALGFS